jgi:hypothetical protein
MLLPLVLVFPYHLSPLPPQSCGVRGSGVVLGLLLFPADSDDVQQEPAFEYRKYLQRGERLVRLQF